jgi:hypothetical protein
VNTVVGVATGGGDVGAGVVFGAGVTTGDGVDGGASEGFGDTLGCGAVNVTGNDDRGEVAGRYVRDGAVVAGRVAIGLPCGSTRTMWCLTLTTIVVGVVTSAARRGVSVPSVVRTPGGAAATAVFVVPDAGACTARAPQIVRNAEVLSPATTTRLAAAGRRFFER